MFRLKDIGGLEQDFCKEWLLVGGLGENILAMPIW